MANLKWLKLTIAAALLAVSAACDDQTCTLDSSNSGCYSPTTSCSSYSFTYTFTFDYTSYPNPSSDFGITVKILSTDSDQFTVTFPNPVCHSGSDDRFVVHMPPMSDLPELSRRVFLGCCVHVSLLTWCTVTLQQLHLHV